jgi:hypothetical protein
MRYRLRTLLILLAVAVVPFAARTASAARFNQSLSGGVLRAARFSYAASRRP